MGDFLNRTTKDEFTVVELYFSGELRSLVNYTWWLPTFPFKYINEWNLKMFANQKLIQRPISTTYVLVHYAKLYNSVCNGVLIISFGNDDGAKFYAKESNCFFLLVVSIRCESETIKFHHPTKSKTIRVVIVYKQFDV